MKFKCSTVHWKYKKNKFKFKNENISTLTVFLLALKCPHGVDSTNQYSPRQDT